MKGIQGRLRSVVGVFVFIVAAQVVVATLTIEVLSAVRAYVTGESLYSKGQKDALLHMRSYVQSHGDEDYRRFLQALAIPEGDGRARRALQQPRPDRDAAFEGFLAGQNHPDDIEAMIHLFVWGQRLPFMARAIRTWTDADRAIGELRRLADGARDRIDQGRLDADEVRALPTRLPELNERLTRLEREFSDDLGEASRLVQALLLGANVIMGILLPALGGWYIRVSLRRERRKDVEMTELVLAVGDCVITADPERRVHLFNRSAEAMFGCKATSARGAPIERFIRGGLPQGTAVRADAAESVRELIGLRSDGSTIHLEASLSTLHLEGGRHTIVVCRDVSHRRVARELERRQLAHRTAELERKAYTDSLTGLPNREALERHLDGALVRVHANGGALAVLFLDLDGFKKVNDVHGHQVGDRLLEEAATRLRQAVRLQDEVFRLSGDEFVAIVTGEAAVSAARGLADRILATIRRPYELGMVTAHVTASIGLASYPEHGTDAHSLLLAADASMYRAKQGGKDMACT